MGKEKGMRTLPLQEQINTLVKALSERGTPGIIMLCIIFIVSWIVPILFLYLFYKIFPMKEIITNKQYLVGGIYLSIWALSTMALVAIACSMGRSVLSSIVPTLKGEAEAMRLMPQAFGGKISTISGSLSVTSLDTDTARKRILKIMQTLIERVTTVLGVSNKEHIRTNIFVCKDGRWLEIANGFHINMKDNSGEGELTIKIPVGYLSSGTAYRYFRPVLSECIEAKNGEPKWDNMPDRETIELMGYDPDTYEEEIKDEIGKAHTDLQWIITMPIPFQVKPFKMSCGVLNVDGLVKLPRGAQTELILTDLSTASALIGVINRTSDILRSQCYRSDNLPNGIKKQKGFRLESIFGIDPESFDPSNCPEPSEEFTRSLARINGLEFFMRISPTEVAEFLREQLRS